MEDEAANSASAFGGGVGAANERFCTDRRASKASANEAVRVEGEDEEVKGHGIDECRGEDGVVGVGDEAPAGLGGPDGLEKDALEDEGPVPKDEKYQEHDDIPVLRPDGHAGKRGV